MRTSPGACTPEAVVQRKIRLVAQLVAQLHSHGFAVGTHGLGRDGIGTGRDIRQHLSKIEAAVSRKVEFQSLIAAVSGGGHPFVAAVKEIGDFLIAPVAAFGKPIAPDAVGPDAALEACVLQYGGFFRCQTLQGDDDQGKDDHRGQKQADGSACVHNTYLRWCENCCAFAQQIELRNRLFSIIIVAFPTEKSNL